MKSLIYACIAGALSTLAAVADPAPIIFPNISTMQASTPPGSVIVHVQGYNSAGDGGGGIFLWSPSSVVPEDHCTVFKAGKLSGGRFVRQLEGLPISVDMCGAHGDGTNAAATRAAFQYANDYVAASPNPNQTILIPGASYNLGDGAVGVVKANSFFGPKWVGSGQSTGAKSTMIIFTPPTEAAAFTFIGGNGAICGCGVENVIFQGNANAIGVELQGQDGANVNVSAFGPMKRIVLLHNKARGQFTEFDHLTINTNGASAGIGTVLEYRVTAGEVSFNGSGLVGGVINYVASDTQGAVLIDAGAFPYNAPLSAAFFPQYTKGETTIVRNNSSTAYGEPSFYGDVRIEQGVAKSISTATGNDMFLSGDVLFFGNAGLWHTGSAHTGYSFGTTPSGQATTFFKPFGSQVFLTGASTLLMQWPQNAHWNFYRLTLEVRGAAYLAFTTLDLVYDEGSSNYYVMNQTNNVVADGRGYGPPVISATTTTISISSSGTPYNRGSSLVASITATQIGQGSGHHSMQ